MTDNVTTMDLAYLVNNLQDIFISIQNSFNNNQKIISSFNEYIINNKSNITNFQSESNNILNELNDKFPLSNKSFNDESINISKINLLSEKLLEINDYLLNLKKHIDDNLKLEQNDIDNINNNFFKKNILHDLLMISNIDNNNILSIGNNSKLINIGINDN